MGSYYSGSGSGTAVSGSLTRLVSEFLPMVESARVGHLLGAPIPNVAASTKATFSYFLRNMFVDGSGLNTGDRLVGQPVPSSEPGQWKTIDALLVDRGSQAILDSSDGYVLTDPDSAAEMDQLGTRLSLTHCLDYMDLLASSVIASSSDPWTAGEQAASAAWTVSGTDILKDITDALDAHEAAVGERLPFGRLTLSVGSKTFGGMLRNSSFTTLWGGAASLGQLTADQLRQSLAASGISDIIVGSDSRYGEYANLYVRSPGGVMSTPNGRLMDSAGLIMPFSGSELVSVLEPLALDQRRWGYYAVANMDLVVVPEFGIRIKETS